MAAVAVSAAQDQESPAIDKQEWWPAPLSEEEAQLRRRAGRLLESLRRIPHVYADRKAWENEHEIVFSLFRRGILDGRDNMMLEAPIYHNRQIEDAWLFLMEIRKRHVNRRKNVQEVADVLGKSYNWSMVLNGSKKIRTALAEFPGDLRLEILEAADAKELMDKLGSTNGASTSGGAESSAVAADAVMAAATSANLPWPTAQEELDSSTAPAGNAGNGWPSAVQNGTPGVWPAAKSAVTLVASPASPWPVGGDWFDQSAAQPHRGQRQTAEQPADATKLAAQSTSSSSTALPAGAVRGRSSSNPFVKDESVSPPKRNGGSPGGQLLAASLRGFEGFPDGRREPGGRGTSPWPAAGDGARQAASAASASSGSHGKASAAETSVPPWQAPPTAVRPPSATQLNPRNPFASVVSSGGKSTPFGPASAQARPTSSSGTTVSGAPCGGTSAGWPAAVQQSATKNSVLGWPPASTAQGSAIAAAAAVAHASGNVAAHRPPSSPAGYGGGFPAWQQPTQQAGVGKAPASGAALGNAAPNRWPPAVEPW